MSVSKIKVYLQEVEFLVRQAKNERKNFRNFMERLGNMCSICLGFHQI